MAYFARNAYTASGGQTDFSVSFPFLSALHLRVYVDTVLQGLGTDYGVYGSIVRFHSGLSAGAEVLVIRDTAANERLVDWNAASVITEADLDVDSLQAFYLAQEAFDYLNVAYEDLSTVFTIPEPANPGDNTKVLTAVDGVATWAVPGTVTITVNDLSDLGTGWLAKLTTSWAGPAVADLTNLGSGWAAPLTSAYVAPRQVPTAANPGDNGKILQANAGSWAWTTKSVTLAQISNLGSGWATPLAAAYVAPRQVPTAANPGDDGKILQANAGSWAWTAKSVTLAQISNLGSGWATPLAAAYVTPRYVPTPANPADDNKFLRANGGTWSWQNVPTGGSVTLSSITDLGSGWATPLAAAYAAPRQVPTAANPGDNTKYLKATDGGWTWERIPYDILCGIAGTTEDAETVLLFAMPRAVRIPNGATDSVLKAGTAATGSSVFSLKKNGTQFGTVTVAASGTTGTFSVTMTDFAIGDILSITAPSTADATLADIGITLAGILL